MISAAEIEQVAALIRSAQHVLVFTGAGISTGSGIPDFRGPNGVWTKRKPVYYQDFMRSELSRIEHWDFKLEGWEGYREAKPNAAHMALVKLEQSGKLEMLVTQNIDGLHSKAGNSPQKIVELHGTNLLVECQSCGERTDPQAHFDFFKQTRKPPMCHCGGFLKPATISFGQDLDAEVLDIARQAALQADLVLALGSSLLVYPAASIPLMAAQNGKPYIIINRGETDHDFMPAVTKRIEADVTELLPLLIDKALS